MFVRMTADGKASFRVPAKDLLLWCGRREEDKSYQL